MQATQYPNLCAALRLYQQWNSHYAPPETLIAQAQQPEVTGALGLDVLTAADLTDAEVWLQQKAAWGTFCAECSTDFWGAQHEVWADTVGTLLMLADAMC